MVLRQILNLLFYVDSIKAVSEMAAAINLQIQYFVNQHLLSIFCSGTCLGTVNTAENKANSLPFVTYWGQGIK